MRNTHEMKWNAVNYENGKDMSGKDYDIEFSEFDNEYEYCGWSIWEESDLRMIGIVMN